MPDTTADHFLDALATRRHLYRVFRNDADMYHYMIKNLEVDNEFLGMRYFVGAQLDDDQATVTFVDGSSVRNVGGDNWEKCR